MEPETAASIDKAIVKTLKGVGRIVCSECGKTIIAWNSPDNDSNIMYAVCGKCKLGTII